MQPNQSEGKNCTKCNVWKPLEEFPKGKRHKNGRKSQCKVCTSEYNKKYLKDRYHQEKEHVQVEGKICIHCGEWKKIDEFEKHNIMKDGHTNRCKACKYAYDKRWQAEQDDFKKMKKDYDRKFYLNHKDEILERNREYRLKNYGWIRVKKKEWRLKNIDRLKQKAKVYYFENAESIKQRVRTYYYENRRQILVKRKSYHARYYRANAERLRAKSKKWYRENIESERERSRKNYNPLVRKKYHFENRERSLQIMKIYYELNRERFIEYKQKRRSEENNLKADLTIEQWREILRLFDNECAYCGSKERLQQEHVIAVTKGGEYTFNNIIPSCKPCNISKSNREWFEWYMMQASFDLIRAEKIRVHQEKVNSL